MAHSVNTDNPFLGVIAVQNPPVFRILAHGYATLWFSTAFFAASFVLSVFAIVALGRTPRVRARALPPYPARVVADSSARAGRVALSARWARRRHRAGLRSRSAASTPAS
jgi:hypothetical protein